MLWAECRQAPFPAVPVKLCVSQGYAKVETASWFYLSLTDRVWCDVFVIIGSKCISSAKVDDARALGNVLLELFVLSFS